jgi:3-deoxy-7-phosphoheptulonate synthase
MLILIKNNSPQQLIDELQNFLNANRVNFNLVSSMNSAIIIVKNAIEEELIERLYNYPIIEQIIELDRKYKLVDVRDESYDGIEVKGLKIKRGKLTIIAGPCAVESKEQIMEIAYFLKESGADILRGGAFKPRTSPYSFQGLGITGLEYLSEAGSAVGLPVISEVMSPEDIDAVAQYVDIIQIGARNMYNYALLKKVGKVNKPILLKRGIMATIEEFLSSTEYILAGGNNQIILCERGIRTFETSTRNTLDISAIPILRSKTYLPIFADPSHASGKSELVPALSKACISAGADGLIIEVHKNPHIAKSDGFQSLNFNSFKKLIQELRILFDTISQFNRT